LLVNQAVYLLEQSKETRELHEADGLRDPSREGSRDPTGTHPGTTREPSNRHASVESHLKITRGNSTTVTVLGPKSASVRPGPCTRPRSADTLTRRELPPGPTDAGVKVVPPRRQRRRPGTARQPTGGCGGSTLTPGRAGWSR
jgi:hypothetical protein